MARRKKLTSDWRKERRNREGSVYEYKGKIYARVQLIGEDGKRKDKKVLAKSRKHARELITTLKGEVKAHGDSVLDSYRMTFGGLAKVYETVKLVPARYEDGRKVAGLRSWRYTKSFMPTLVAHFGRRQLRSIRHSDLEAFRLERLGTPVRCGTDENDEPIYRPRRMASVHRELGLLRAMLRYAEREGWIVRSPFDGNSGLISTANETKRDRILTRDEEMRLLAGCVGRREHLRPILMAALDTGMRRGELFKLTWEDVDLNAKLIYVRATKVFRTIRKDPQKSMSRSLRLYWYDILLESL
jgi:integrase